MSEFKVGDIVSFYADNEHGFTAILKGIVTNYRGTFGCEFIVVNVNGKEFLKSFHPRDQVKKLTLNVGDRFAIEINGKKEKGTIKKLNYPYVNHDLYYSVALDNKLLCGGFIRAADCKKLVKKKKEFKAGDRIKIDGNKATIMDVNASWFGSWLSVIYDATKIKTSRVNYVDVDYSGIKKLKPKKPKPKFKIGDKVVDKRGKVYEISQVCFDSGKFHYSTMMKCWDPEKTLSLYKEPFKITGPGVYETHDGAIISIQRHVEHIDKGGRWEGELSKAPSDAWLNFYSPRKEIHPRDRHWFWRCDGTFPFFDENIEANRIIKRISDLPEEKKEEFKVTKPGIYRMRNGRTAVVLCFLDRDHSPCLGYCSDDITVRAWNKDGKYCFAEELPYDLIEHIGDFPEYERMKYKLSEIKRILLSDWMDTVYRDSQLFKLCDEALNEL